MSANKQYKKQVKDALKEREQKLVLKHRFDTRITNVRQGKEAFDSGDFITAIRRYTEYLETLAQVHHLPGIYDLRPEHFHKTKDVTEILMLSHLYFELAKVYDATGKFEEDTQKCLDQFVLFSINQPFQVVNSEMARKHLRKFHFKNHQVFFRAYQQIFVKSRKCYVATHCFGEDHHHTERLRHFKRWLLQHNVGVFFVENYYRFSPLLVSYLDGHPRLAWLFNFCCRPLLQWFSSGPLRFIIKQ